MSSFGVMYRFSFNMYNECLESTLPCHPLPPFSIIHLPSLKTKTVQQGVRIRLLKHRRRRLRLCRCPTTTTSLHLPRHLHLPPRRRKRRQWPPTDRNISHNQAPPPLQQPQRVNLPSQPRHRLRGRVEKLPVSHQIKAEQVTAHAVI